MEEYVVGNLIASSCPVPKGILCGRFSVTTPDEALFLAVMAAYLSGEGREDATRFCFRSSTVRGRRVGQTTASRV